MNCVKDGLIQRYIDHEALPEEITLVENHISYCKKCSSRVEDQRSLSACIKQAIHQIQEDSIEIPKFEIPANRSQKQILLSKRLYYLVAAASIMLFIIIYSHRKGVLKDHEIIFENGSVLDVDANRTPLNFPLVINIIDTKGNISEHIIN